MIIVDQHPYIWFVVGLLVLAAAFYMLSQAERIRKSRYWFVAFLAYPLLIANGFKMMLPVLDPVLPNVREDVAIPILFVSVIVLAFGMFFYQWFKLKRSLR